MLKNHEALFLLAIGFLGLLAIHLCYAILAVDPLMVFWKSYLWDYNIITVYVLAWLFVGFGAIQLFFNWKALKGENKAKRF